MLPILYNNKCKEQNNNPTEKENGTMTNTSKKMTKKDYFNTLLTIEAVSANADLVAFINHELELLDRKNSGEKKPTATQLANDGLKNAILEHMEVDKLYTITDFIKNVPECAELSTPKVSALVKQLKDAGIVVRVEEKRKAYFKLA